MSSSTATSSGSDPNELDALELQLQQELRAMFEVDSQQYLQDYLNQVQRLQPQSWTGDIQDLYRAIHTIKGGSVTVGADAILKVASILEDLLSDLRHLSPAPPLEDGKLGQMLLEAGELLAGSLGIEATGQDAMALVEPSVQHIQRLREQIRQTYLPEWDEQTQLHQEFAEQGFDLVVLDLEMVVEQLSPQTEVTRETLEIAQQTLLQLVEIGQDLQFAAGWNTLLSQMEVLLTRPTSDLWRAEIPVYLRALKACARKGGASVDLAAIAAEVASSATPASTSVTAVEDVDLTWTEESALDLPEAIAIDEPLELDFDDLSTAVDQLSQVTIDEAVTETVDLSGFNDFGDLSAVEFIEFDELSQAADQITQLDLGELSSTLDQPLQLAEPAELSAIAADVVDELSQLDFVELVEAADALTDLDLEAESLTLAPTELPALETITPSPESPDAWLGLVAPAPTQPTTPSPAAIETAPSLPTTQSILTSRRADAEPSDIQIPVPLNRLDQTAQNLVEALLTTRASQGLYQNLQSQLAQLFALAKESADYITRLRQIQDDYALLDSLKTTRGSSAGPTVERYRQGYITINRLLETSLRLSELGAEAEKTASQTAESLQSLDRNILRLRQTVEQSRLVPFKNIGFRAKAILRDLTTRFAKPARLVVKGEQVELDAGTASKLEPALLHLIRNAYDHGLEGSAERVARNKPEQGTITLTLRRRGNSFLLDVEDDGRGIDAEAIARSAAAKRLPLTRTQTPAELLSVLCQAGFSSRDAVSDISGRGVGMDVVANQVASLGGRLSLETIFGAGSRFRLQFPVPHLLVDCVLLQAGDRTFAIPSEDIATTTLFGSLKAAPKSQPQAPYSWEIQWGDGMTPGLDLLEYWQPSGTTRTLPESAVCAYIRIPDSSQGLWVLADDLVGQAELLITPLPSPLTAPIGLVGVSLQVDGSLVPVIEPVALAETLLRPSAATVVVPAMPTVTPASPELPPEESERLTRTILVVDDAALMRRRLEASLTAYGYQVTTCADGQEAWNWLQTHPTPAMVITDIEMPNMDGFTLIDRCRQAGITIPMLVVSSRLAEEWSKEARRLGATDYLTKGFSTTDLINKVKILLG